MNLNQLKTLYTRSPLWIKKLYATIPYEIRNGKEYRDWKKFLTTEIDEEAYQLLKLKETLDYAYNHTVYYKKVFDELNFSIEDFKQLSDIQYFPLIDKETVRENYDDMRVKSYPKNKSFYVTTGGSSGEPMKFLQSKNVWAKELAFVNHYFEAHNFKLGELKASFRGGDFHKLNKHEFWNINPINHEIHFSPFHINAHTIKAYVKILNQKQIKIIHAYPSTILSLMEQMKANQLSLNYQPTSIFLISENINQKEIEAIANYFSAEVSSFFGHSERIVFAPLNPHTHQSYRPMKRYGHTELVADNEGNMEIVGSNFDNYAMPLIRYKTGDFSDYIDEHQEEISLIKGRWDKAYLEGKDGLKLTLTALNMHSDIFKNVIHFQFLQKETAKVELLIVPNNDYHQEDEKNILNALYQKGGHALDFSIKIMTAPILSKRGKLQKLIKTTH